MDLSVPEPPHSVAWAKRVRWYFLSTIDTTFSDRAVRQGTRVFAMDLPEETDTLALGSPFDRGELVSIEVTLDAGLVAKGKEQ